MQSPPVIDFDRLSAPIAEDAPAGVDLRAAGDGTYHDIRAERTNARRIEKKLADGEQPDPKNPLDWGKVLHPCLKALTEKTKDLELAAYAIEALLRLHGPAGLRDGFRLTRKLVETFWDDLYPSFEVEDDGSPEPRKSVEKRVAMLAGLNGNAERDGALWEPVRKIVIASSSRLGDFRYLQYEDAVLRSRQDDLDKIESAARETDATFYRELFGNLTACVEEFTRLTVALDERCKYESPPSSSLREILQGCQDCVRTLAGGKLEDVASAETPAAGGQNQPEAGPAGNNPGPGVLRSREDAFHTLQKVAEYFRRTEPHSVLSYSLEQLIKWGRMSLPELLVELIADPSSRETLFTRVGIKAPPEKTE